MYGMSLKVVSRWQHLVTNSCLDVQQRLVEAYMIIFILYKKQQEMKFCHVFHPLHPHGQASLLRSHAGGLSVVATTECMLYAASEVSVILQAGSVARHPPSLALPPQPTTFLCCWFVLGFFCLTLPVLFLPSLCSISYLAGTLNGVLVFNSYLLPEALVS